MIVERLDYFGKIAARKDPDNYEQQLEPEAIGFIKGVFKLHPDIRIHLARRDPRVCELLHTAEDRDAFKQAMEGVFGGDTVHVLATAEQDLMELVGPVMTGKPSLRLAEIYADDPEMVLHLKDIVTTAKRIIGGLKDELQPIVREPVLVPASITY
ncbi:hypothetical protein A2W45_02935 [Candidatus Curtissbacteria bacterium RIFCSPHIGHO2_12_41_11]|uniref:Uncharacterized protein n=3 Tax=Candidatus Curtissiibacteriota TaxID=1752717 RepID=A0A1F5HUH2_9BACT|nr:MAG: hypothetical protein UU56_C0026G0010 [Candidatus Curtissbacteria bacterium GW2011_GWA2_41_24]OGD88634.1 MAG: hypothetical protein A2Z54_02595 [Candidatus Curtissbacteria bacterium RIFCSPHIGHO2_02_39_8]OGD99708.1 MAG: hypothetical protein A2W45_02935 [Candidatus Curtissbacteria bacterium RIFCSPHIGHO2_12_41_11]OGE07615.1 MAG: hypothetical protein A2W70_02390 [Candidatus Curtissbacteria bacterium RIFCSPLOWO2_02_41_11]